MLTGTDFPTPSPRSTCRARSSPGYTLLETLAAVAILVTLIAMLVPALAKARRQSQAAACLSNLQQIYDAYASYRHGNGEHTYLRVPSADGVWVALLRPLIADGSNLWFCPEARTPSFGWGSAHTAWGPYDPAHGTDPSLAYIGTASSSYGFNGWLYGRRGFSRHILHHPSWDRLHVPLFLDANWMDARPDPSDPLPADLEHGSGFGDPEMGRFTLARHSRSVNVLFIDGHAAQYPPEELWGMDWTPMYFQPPPPPDSQPPWPPMSDLAPHP